MKISRRLFAGGIGALAFRGASLVNASASVAHLHVPRYGASIASNGERAVLSGGATIGTANTDTLVYSGLLGLIETIDPQSLTQVFAANAAFPRANHTSVWMRDGLWLIGGRTSHGFERELLVETEIVDLESQAIRRGPDLPMPLIHLAAALHGETVCVFGGIYRDASSGQSRVSRQVFACAPPYTGWEERSPMPVALSHCGVVEHAGRLYLVGGYDRNRAHAIVQIYDPSKDTWSAGPPPPIPLSAHASATSGDWLFTFGDYQDQSAVYGLSIRSGAWRRLTLPFQPRRHVRAVFVRDRVIVAGGNTSSQAAATDVLESFSLEQLKQAYKEAEKA
ncbi:MAG: hypothetical protein AAGF72_15180 [Pseudomonadota bacterium]